MDNTLTNSDLVKEYALNFYQIEELRTRYIQRRNIFFLKASGIIVTGSSVLGFLFYFLSSSFIRELLIMGSAIVTFLFLVFLIPFFVYQIQAISKQQKAFINGFKSTVIKKVVQNLYPKLQYNKSAIVPLNKLLETNRYNSYDRLISKNEQDSILGNFLDIQFKLSEATIYGESDYEEGKTHHKVFNGLIIHIHSNQQIEHLNHIINSSIIKHKMEGLQKFWGSYPQITTFDDGDIIVDLVLLDKQFLEPPQANVKIYDPSYIDQLNREISLLIEFIEEIRSQL